MATADGLYIGDEALPSLGRYRKTGGPVFLDPADLVTHLFVCGASGFGKTILSKSVVEEAALAGIPSIVVDVKGDLASLAIPALALQDPHGGSDLLRSILGEEFEDQAKGAAQAMRESPTY